MQQQQSTNNGRLQPAENSLPMFGSLLIDEKSLTPYSDATQVFVSFFLRTFFKYFIIRQSFTSSAICENMLFAFA